MFRFCCTFIATAVVTTIAIASTWSASAQQPTRVSPHETIGAVFGGKGGGRVTIYHGRPYSKDPKGTEIRKIWNWCPGISRGGMGSDEATTLVAEYPIMLGDKMVPTGAYTLYLLPSEKGSTKLVVSSKVGGDGETPDAKFDVARIDMKKDKLDKQVDQFTITLTPDKDQPKGELKLMWETTQFSVPIVVKK